MKKPAFWEEKLLFNPSSRKKHPALRKRYLLTHPAFRKIKLEEKLSLMSEVTGLEKIPACREKVIITIA